MRKKIIIAIGVLLAGLIMGNLFAKRKVKKLKEEYREAEKEKQHFLHVVKMERAILEAKEKTEEIEKYAELGEKLQKLDPLEDSDKVNDILTEFMEKNDIPCPYGDWSFESFDKFMRDPNSKLIF